MQGLTGASVRSVLVKDSVGQQASKEFNLRKVVAQAFPRDPEFENEEVEMSCDFRPGLPDDVAGDPESLQQVIAILLEDAIQYAGRGRVEMRVEEVYRTADEVSVHFAIRAVHFRTTVERTTPRTSGSWIFGAVL